MTYLADTRRQRDQINVKRVQRRVLGYGDCLMAVEFTFEGGMESAIHSRPHEQIGYLVSGSLGLFMESREVNWLEAGCSCCVPLNSAHGVRILEPTALLDCFALLREDLID